VRALKAAAARNGRRLTVAVAGCVAQAEGEEIIRRAPVVDLVVGPQNYHRLPGLLARAEREGAVVDTEFPVEDKFDILRAPSRAATRARGVSAFVTVQEGCDKFCTFCVVPYTRGAEVSRPVIKIVAEVERLADAGVREVTLIGQNVNAYHGEVPDGAAWTLGRLLERVAELPGIARLRYTTSHPCDMEASLVAAHRDLPQPDALSAPAGAVWFRPNPRAHESPPHSRGLSKSHCAHARCATEDGVLVRLYRRLPRRERGGFSRDAVAPRRGRLRRRLFLQVLAAAGNAGRGHAGSGAGGGEIRAALPLAGGHRPPPRLRSTRDASAAASRFCSKRPDAMLARSSAAPHISSRFRSWHPR